MSAAMLAHCRKHGNHWLRMSKGRIGWVVRDDDPCYPARVRALTRLGAIAKVKANYREATETYQFELGVELAQIRARMCSEPPVGM